MDNAWGEYQTKNPHTKKTFLSPEAAQTRGASDRSKVFLLKFSNTPNQIVQEKKQTAERALKTLELMPTKTELNEQEEKDLRGAATYVQDCNEEKWSIVKEVIHYQQ